MVTAAKILSQRAYSVPGKIKVTENFFQVPLDWETPYFGPDAVDSIRLFARSAQRVNKPADPTSDDQKKQAETPWLLFLQGGPGFGCASPQNNAFTQMMLDRGYQLLYLDQRGTGLSTPLTASTLAIRGDNEAQARYMRFFRADSIVKDCEAVRMALTKDLPHDKKQFTVMGQSFGGFCCVTYLSFFPDAVREAFIFGGLPPMVDRPDDVYRRLFQKVIERNRAYYEKYEADVERVQRICSFLQRSGNTTVEDVVQGGYLTARRFMTLGWSFAFHGGFDQVHELVLRADNDLDLFGHLTRPTITRITGLVSLDNAIIYAALHEPIYCQGSASNWSAERMKQEHLELFEIPQQPTAKPIYFTGEMVFPSMFDDFAELRQIADQTNIVQRFEDWPRLYDEVQLARNNVPVYAAVYLDDMCVDYDLSMETAKKIKGCKVFVTNQILHDGIRSRTDDVMKTLFALRDDTLD